jgi:hypothetical protein
VHQPMLELYVAYRVWRVNLWYRAVGDESGEGVVSTAIAVLIMSLLGLAMWLAFRQIFDDATQKTGDQVNQIGS